MLIKNTWLQVTFEGNDAAGGFNTNTQLAASDVFYFGNRMGDQLVDSPAALAFTTNAGDEIAARLNPGLQLAHYQLVGFRPQPTGQRQ